MSSADDFKKLSHHEQILKLPDTYVGSYSANPEQRWIWDTPSSRMVWRTVLVNPALLKIADEVLVNALDHRVRLQEKKAAHQVKHIDVTITPERITVRNDGEGIPVEQHVEEKCYVPELIFGHLLTSSNYTEGEKRIVGGKNGYGAKLTNIFSKEFSVETVDAKNQKKYKQVWRKNMYDCGKPEISKSKEKPYTEISFVPDLARFKWGDEVPAEIPKDMLDVLYTRVVDAAACAGIGCKVTLNGNPVLTNNFTKYIDLYTEHDTGSETGTTASDDGASVAGTYTSGGSSKRMKKIAYEQAGDRWEVGAILTHDLHGDTPPEEGRNISFANGVSTRRSGKHVEYVSKEILTAFCEVAKKKTKLAGITPALLKQSVVWFINATIENPSFDNQAKEYLTTAPKEFGSFPKFALKKEGTDALKFVDQLVKIGLLEEAEHVLNAKTSREAKKTDGKKRCEIRGIPKLEDAQWAGTGRSTECTLILTEGDSAKTTALSGLNVVGRERYGIFPLKGKILNVKDVSIAKKNANQELTYIKQILGLEHGKVYTELKHLRYGRIMIMTDQDVDGSHIKGLLMNLFHTDWPSLLDMNFLCCLMTPLLKVSKGKETSCFYSETEYEAWLSGKSDAEQRGWKVKYYKGLGTSTRTEAIEYFKTMNTVEFECDKATNHTLDLAFNKKRADDRKVWLTSYDRKRHLCVGSGGARVSYTRFVNDELIHFSIADNIRSIPHIMDGLKPSQRKILWSCLKRNLTQEIKVAQLAGYVSEHAAYHHGEASLNGAIVGMAQNFVGSNNLNLLFPSGQFGSRYGGGTDASSERYIFTTLEPIVRQMIRKEDDSILNYMEDDGQKVEPETYMPCIPLLLANGAVGIGTGYSTHVLSYNPSDLISSLKSRLNGQESLTTTTLSPWWYGFKGNVSGSADGKTWTTKGVYEFADDDACIIRITELPVGSWTQDYKNFLEQIRIDQEEDLKKWTSAAKDAKDKGKPLPEKPTRWLKNIEGRYDDIVVDFVLYMDPEYYHEARAYSAEFEAKFKLTTTHKTTNMVAFDTKGILRKFNTVGDILEEFFVERRRMYGIRKEYELERMRKEIVELDARLVFIKAVVERRLILANAEDTDLLAGMKGLHVPPLSAPDDPNDLKAYDYLLRMRVDRLKASSLSALEKDVADAKVAMVALEATTIESLWMQDLDMFESAWSDFMKRRDTAFEEAEKEGAVEAAKKVIKRRAPAARKVKAKA